MIERRRLIIDCDPGIDDAVALFLAVASTELEILAVTTVGGNVPLAQTWYNARALLTLAGRDDVPVHGGCAAPLVGALTTAEHVHGDDGLGGIALPPPRRPAAPAHAADAIIELVMTHPPHSITLCAMGPLTNLAFALLKEPRLAGRLREIVLMGGARDLGNITPAAEYNIFGDPHAAAQLFAAGVPLTMLGLEATRHVVVDEARRRMLAALPNPVARATVAMFAPVPGQERRIAYLHDVCVIAWLVEPGLFGGRRCRVEIETEGRWCRGRTVVDWDGRGSAPTNALVVDRTDADGFFRLLGDRLRRFQSRPAAPD